MAYTTKEIIREESPFKDVALIVDVYVDRAISQADSLIDGVIGEVYSLPLASTPAMVQDISTQLTIFNLFRDQNINIEIASGVDVSTLIEDAMATLEMIRSRKIKLFDVNGNELSVTDRIKPKFYPTTVSTDAGATAPLFEINKQF